MARYKLIASGYIFLIRDSTILLVRRCNTGYEDGNYGVPSGHMEEHETLAEGMAREIREEIGLEIPTKYLEMVHVMHRQQQDERIDFFFTAKQWQGEPENKEPEKCDDLRWFPLDALPDNIIP